MDRNRDTFNLVVAQIFRRLEESEPMMGRGQEAKLLHGCSAIVSVTIGNVLQAYFLFYSHSSALLLVSVDSLTAPTSMSLCLCFSLCLFVLVSLSLSLCPCLYVSLDIECFYASTVIL